MAGVHIDHMVSLITFLLAMMLFIGMFSQTIKNALTYQNNNVVAFKCSDLLDNIMLSPGIPPQWGQTDDVPAGFGLQAADFTQYQLSPFSLMRLRSSIGEAVNYTMTGQYYSNISIGFGQSLLVPYSEALDYSTASNLLGINGSYGFSLTLTPIVNITILPTNSSNFSIDVTGLGFPLANADVDYCLITVDCKEEGAYPQYQISYGSTVTDSAGSASLSFPGFDGNATSFALVACAHLSNVVGMGYYSHVLYDASYVIPLVSSIENGTAILAHSWDVIGGSDPDAAIHYNATFVVLANDLKLREMQLANDTGSAVGLLNSGEVPELAYDTLTLGTGSPGILIVSYSTSVQDTGIVVMPWGLSSLAFPITFGGNPNYKRWVATDIRQVMVNSVTYQAKLSVWSLSGYEVSG
jgi:hypothetical protein